MIFNKLLFIFFTFLFIQSYSQEIKRTPEFGMLILGSADEATTKKRVQVGYNLFNSDIKFDYIIVAGGCGAHGSEICEAELMKKILQEKGVPEELIFIEDKSRTTAQNYCFSKRLKKADGLPVIKKDDVLYVVSNHWHAISVAGCFNLQDSVKAQYHIEGAIRPKETDKTDYVNIFKNCSENKSFCTSLLWPLVDASFFSPMKNGGESFYFIQNLQFNGASEFENLQATKISNSGLMLSAEWESGIDAAFLDANEKMIYFFKGTQFLRFEPYGKIGTGYPKNINMWIRNLPETWEEGNFDAAFMGPKGENFFLFKGIEYIKVSLKTLKVESGYPQQIKDLVKPWPFQWGRGELDAALFNPVENKVYLFRGMEVLKATWNDTFLIPESNYPIKVPLSWPEELLGVKP